jgi:hypothetical protein
MTAIFADVVVPEIDPLVAARRYPAGDLRTVLEGLREVALDVGVGEVWSGARVAGTDRGEGPPGAAPGVVGVSLAFACLVGAGFWRERDLPAEVPPAPPAPGGGPGGEAAGGTGSEATPLREAVARKLRESAAAGARLRGPQVDAVRRVAAAASGRAPFPLRAALDVRGTWLYDFVEAYRRRLAYALAFEASLTAGSLRPYGERLPALLAGGLPELIDATPGAADPLAFSVVLNLLRILDGALAYEAATGRSHPDLPGPVRAGEPKRAFLRERLLAAAAARQEHLHADGRVAVQALLEELELMRQEQRRYDAQPPLFGTLAGSSAYRGASPAPPEA